VYASRTRKRCTSPQYEQTIFIVTCHILASDALCSSSDATHDALMTLYRERFSQQIETVETATILAAWPS